MQNNIHSCIQKKFQFTKPENKGYILCHQHRDFPFSSWSDVSDWPVLESIASQGILIIGKHRRLEIREKRENIYFADSCFAEIRRKSWCCGRRLYSVSWLFSSFRRILPIRRRRMFHELFCYLPPSSWLADSDAAAKGWPSGLKFIYRPETLSCFPQSSLDYCD